MTTFNSLGLSFVASIAILGVLVAAL